MIRKSTILITVIVVLICCFSTFVLADIAVPPELLEEANKAGIVTDGLTIIEIKTKIVEARKADLIDKSNTDSANKDKQVEPIAEQNKVVLVISAVVNPEILEIAEQAGIKTDGLTTFELKTKIVEARNTAYREKANILGIDIAGLSDYDIREKVLTIENAHVIAKAKLGGINTDGLTYSQVIAAVDARYRENAYVKPVEDQ